MKSIEPTTSEAADSANDPSIEQAPKRSTRVRIKPKRYEILVDYDQNITLLENDELKSYKEILKSS